MTKLLFTFLAALCCTVMAFAANGIKIDNIYYILDDTNLTATVTWGGEDENSGTLDYKGSITIPSTVTNDDKTYNVTSIGEKAFYLCTGLTSITIPESVTSIGPSAFDSCSGLTSIEFPKNVKSIDLYAFYDCQSLNSVIFHSLPNINYNAFNNCGNLTQIILDITDSEKPYIGNSSANYPSNGFTSATYHGKLTPGTLGTIVLPFVPERTEALKFYKFTSVANDMVNVYETQYIQAGVPYLIKNVSDNADFTLSATPPSAIAVNTSNLSCDGFMMKGTFQSQKLTNTDSKNFYCLDDGNFKIIEGEQDIAPFRAYLESTGSSEAQSMGVAFSDHILTFVDGYIPTTTTEGQYEHWHCSHCDLDFFDEQCTKEVGEGALIVPVAKDDEIWYTTINKQILIPNETNVFGATYSNNVYEKGLGKIKFGKEVTSIGSGAFQGCSDLTSITIPESVESIGLSAFTGCSGLTSITIPESVESIGSIAFAGCLGLTSITIGNGVTSIGDRAFQSCLGLTSITIPESVESIGSSAFADCSGLTSITIGNGVTSIGDRAFQSCSGLTSITIPESVESIGSSAFADCSGLTSITIGNGVTSIGDRAFQSCSGLTSITIPESVKSIGKYAFDVCTKVKELIYAEGTKTVLPTGLTSITSVTIPNSVTSIGGSAFDHCSGLTSITIPESVTSIGDYTFQACSGLTSMTIPESVKSIGKYAFRNCSGLTSITIPESVTSIGQDAFTRTGWYDNQQDGLLYLCNCLIGYKGTALTGDIVIAAETRTILDNAFTGCNLTDIVVLATNPPTLSEHAFDGVDKNIPVYVPDIQAYKKTEPNWNWGGFTNIINWTDYKQSILGEIDEALKQGPELSEKYQTIVTECMELINNATDVTSVKTKKTEALAAILQNAKEHALGEIDAEMSGLNTFTDAERSDIDSYKNAINEATDNTAINTAKEAAMVIIKFCQYKDEAIKTLNGLIANKVGVDISGYINDIINATSKEQIDELKNQATDEINKMTFATIGTQMYKLDVNNDAYTFEGSITINDKDCYESDHGFTVNDKITYNRTFTNTNWQPLYVPFAISYSDWSDGFDVAAINNFHEYTNDMGQTIRTELEIRMVKSGTLKPNHPYLIKANDAPKPLQIELTTKEISKSDNKSYSCSSMESQYTFTGTYREIAGLKTNDYIFMSGGKLCKATADSVKLSPQRWYLKITSLGSQVDGGNTSEAKPMEFDIKLLDDEATDIDEITVTRTPLRNSSEAIYNLNGMRVNDSYKGIVIKNGKKVLQK